MNTNSSQRNGNGEASAISRLLNTERGTQLLLTVIGVVLAAMISLVLKEISSNSEQISALRVTMHEIAIENVKMKEHVESHDANSKFWIDEIKKNTEGIEKLAHKINVIERCCDTPYVHK